MTDRPTIPPPPLNYKSWTLFALECETLMAAESGYTVDEILGFACAEHAETMARIAALEAERETYRAEIERARAERDALKAEIHTRGDVDTEQRRTLLVACQATCFFCRRGDGILADYSGRIPQHFHSYGGRQVACTAIEIRNVFDFWAATVDE